MNNIVKLKLKRKPRAGWVLPKAAERAQGHVVQLVAAMVDEAPAEHFSEFGRNEHLRRERRKAWQKAESKLDYWKAYRQLHYEIGRANELEVLDDLDCPATLRCKHEDDPLVLNSEMVCRVHAAEVELLLTPAPDLASLNWKRKRIKHQWYQLGDPDAEYLRRHFGREQSPVGEIEKAMVEDEAWLDAHPTRNSKASRERRGPPRPRRPS